ncbi:MAG: bifunctional fucokinase/fucose-1-phosphate guanylyltransferase [Bacteroidales bacterium]|nr:bifunctional fucokinase/fucose-1-phosphate guanylyltransferase [Bacteroidales bacterium]
MSIERLITLPPRMAEKFHELENKEQDAWFCGSDPAGKKAGSGGGSAYLLWLAYRKSGFTGSLEEWLMEKRRLLIHSGGESRRLPAYAPYGKSLLPIPVFRWSKGQDLDQKLLGFQASFYEKILQNAPACYTTLIGSGDVMFISSDRFQKLPEADVLLFGIWVEDQVASRHGVFFSRRHQQNRLAFVRQKPSVEELSGLAQDYFYLMDSGIVMMNRETTLKLMKKSLWDEKSQTFKGGAPGYYDLYGDMLTAFGEESGSADSELAALTVKLVPLQEGEFYHFGTSSDMIESTLRLQNRITDQRLKYSRESDHHPSIFQQNADVKVEFSAENHHIWIENSYIPSTWKLNHHHILTGIPSNSWKVLLPANICLDLVPLEEDEYCLRIYGYGDEFGESADRRGTWMNQELKQWLIQRNITPENAGFTRDASMYELPLFPVGSMKMLEAVLKEILEKKRQTSLWLKSLRLSAKELAERAGAEKLYRQREDLRLQSLPRLAANHPKSIFYFLDLEKISTQYCKSGLELPAELSNKEPLIKRMNDYMFRARVLGNREHALHFEKRAFGMLRQEMIRTLKAEPLSPRRNVLDDQILWGRSPVRLDLAGGWTDTPPYCIMEGGKVVNLSVELNGQLPLQVYVRPLAEMKIILRSIDLGEKTEINNFEELNNYDQPGGGFSIPKAALVLCGFGPMFSGKHYADLASQLKAFGCGIEMSLLAAIPKGSGLGTSSNLAATVLGTLNDFCALGWDKHEIAYRTLILEQMLTTGGGWQDQFGGIFGGVKLLETEAGIRQSPGIKWLPDQLFTNRETREMLLLYYTGVTRVAHDILGEIVKGMFLNSSGHLEIFKEMKIHALETFGTILSNDYEGLAAKVALSWVLNQHLDEGTNPQVIRAIIQRVEDYLLGYKLLGAGGGGYLIMFAKSAEAALRARKNLEADPPNARARFVDFSVSKSGFQVSRS